MKPSSSTSDGLFAGLSARGAVAVEVGDTAWLQAMLDVEAALARAAATVGLVPIQVAARITESCRAELFDAGVIGRAATAAGNPVVPLVRALTELVGGDAAAAVHRGATSQDILDTAAMLVARRAVHVLRTDVGRIGDTLAGLARAERDTLLAGRTLLQQALPTTFGLKAAGWLCGLDAALARLVELDRNRLAVQLGGAAGTLASLGADGPAVVAALAAELGLAEPVLPWHAERSRIAELAAALGVLAGALAKVATDVVLLAQTEVGEVSEGGPAGHGGSSTLPHKRNPVHAVTAVANCHRVPALVASLLAGMAGQQERAAGVWQAEWEPLSELFRLVGSAATSVGDCLGGLVLHRDAMRANLDRTDGLLLAEHVTTMMAQKIGRLPAHDVVQAACGIAVAEGRPLADVLSAEIDVDQISAHQIEAALDPAGYLGSAATFIDRALAHHEEATR